MADFSVRITDRNGVAMLAPAGVTLTPTGWSAAAMGGPVGCEVELAGDTATLLGLAAWLGYGVEIIGEAGELVWWGQVTAIEVSAHGVRRGLSIADICNRAKLVYVRLGSGGVEEATETAWEENATSVSLYGLRERVFTAGTLTDSQATAMVATLIGRLATPQRSIRLESGSSEKRGVGRLTGRGWFARLDDIYYVNVSGLEEHNPGSGTAIPVGLGFTSAYLAWVDAGSKKLVQECLGKFKHFGDYTDLMIKVVSVYNGGSKMIERGDGRDPISYTSTFTMEPNDDLFDANNGLSFLATDDVYWLDAPPGNFSGNPLGARRVKTAGSHGIEVSPGWNGGYGFDGPNTATIYRGNGVTITTDVANEAPDGTTVKSVEAYGQRVYQSFSLAANTTWSVDRIEVRIRRVGSPMDNLRVGLYIDSSGSPGTMIEQATVAGAALADEMAWVVFGLTASQVAYGTIYGIQIDRTGAMDAFNFYEVEIDPEAGYGRGAMRVYDGSAWQAATGNLIFRTVGAVNALDLAAAVVGQAGTEIRRTVMEATTGVEAWQYATGEETAGAVLRRLLKVGDVEGRRLLATVTADRALRVFAQNESYDAWLRLYGGQPGWLDGAPLQAGVLPVGRWVELGDVALLSDAWSGLDRVFVERAVYRVGQGCELEAEGQRSVVERLGVQMG